MDAFFNDLYIHVLNYVECRKHAIICVYMLCNICHGCLFIYKFTISKISTSKIKDNNAC